MVTDNGWIDGCMNKTLFIVSLFYTHLHVNLGSKDIPITKLYLVFLVSSTGHNTVSKVPSPFLNPLWYVATTPLFSKKYIYLSLTICSINLHTCDPKEIGLLFTSLLASFPLHYRTYKVQFSLQFRIR